MPKSQITNHPSSITPLGPAGFWIRLLAFLLEFAIELVPSTLFALLVSTSSSLEDLIFRLVIYLTVWLIPFIIVGIALYIPWFTMRFGGTLGKIITGIRVTDEDGKLLTYKRAFFRQNIAYAFSGLLFGWGFWSIARDPDKMGWHDKATGSRVWKTKNLWPFALLILVALCGFHAYFLTKAFLAIRMLLHI